MPATYSNYSHASRTYTQDPLFVARRRPGRYLSLNGQPAGRLTGVRGAENLSVYVHVHSPYRVFRAWGAAELINAGSFGPLIHFPAGKLVFVHPSAHRKKDGSRYVVAEAICKIEYYEVTPTRGGVENEPHSHIL